MRSRILTRRTAGLLGIAGLTVTATVGFAAAATADQSPTASTGETAATTATVALSGPSSVKSSGTATYTVTLNVANGPMKGAKLTPGGSWHGGTITWTKGCDTVDGVVCNLGDVDKTATAVVAYSAPKVSKNTGVTLTVSAAGKGANDSELSSAKSHSLTVKKAATPTPTKTAKPSPTKSSSKPSPSKSGQGHTASHKPTSHETKSKTPSSSPTGQQSVPYPTSVPNTVPTGVPSIPAGTEAPFTNPTDTPTLPSVAPSPEGSPRSPNVAEPPNKASGQVRNDAVSVPAAAAAAFVGLGAGTMITRSVRRRGLWRSVGRHRD